MTLIASGSEMDTSSGAIRKIGPYLRCAAVISLCSVPFNAPRSRQSGETVARNRPGTSRWGWRYRKYIKQSRNYDPNNDKNVMLRKDRLRVHKDRKHSRGIRRDGSHVEWIDLLTPKNVECVRGVEIPAISTQP